MVTAIFLDVSVCVVFCVVVDMVIDQFCSMVTETDW